MTREELIECRDTIERMMKFHSQNLKKFPRTAIGMTPDYVKKDATWRYHKDRYNAFFAALRKVNQQLTRN